MMQAAPSDPIAKGVVRGTEHIIIVIIEPMNLHPLLVGQALPVNAIRYRAYVEDTGELVHENLSWPMIDAATDAWLDGIARGYDMGVLHNAEVNGQNTLEATRDKAVVVGPTAITVISSAETSEWVMPNFGGSSPSDGRSEEDSGPEELV